ncbi:MAG: uracil-DNA glycosylase family protein [Pseudomonadota bacterium]
MDLQTVKRKKSKGTRLKPPATAPSTLKTLEEVRSWLGDCKRCGLCKERNEIVFGSGNPKARLMFIGEGPGADEDKQGLPFVGRAGQLLSKIIEAMGLQRENVYIANIVKCRPPSNRVPEPHEIDQCLPFLKAQIDLVSPEIVVALGLTASRALTQTEHGMANLRGQFHTVAWKKEITLMPTYHPAYLLRNPSAKKIVWEDMKLVKERLKL